MVPEDLLYLIADSVGRTPVGSLVRGNHSSKLE